VRGRVRRPPSCDVIRAVGPGERGTASVSCPAGLRVGVTGTCGSDRRIGTRSLSVQCPRRSRVEGIESGGSVGIVQEGGTDESFPRRCRRPAGAVANAVMSVMT
jgi:hypothetical protein